MNYFLCLIKLNLILLKLNLVYCVTKLCRKIWKRYQKAIARVMSFLCEHTNSPESLNSVRKCSRLRGSIGVGTRSEFNGYVTYSNSLRINLCQSELEKVSIRWNSRAGWWGSPISRFLYVTDQTSEFDVRSWSRFGGGTFTDGDTFTANISLLPSYLTKFRPHWRKSKTCIVSNYFCK